MAELTNGSEEIRAFVASQGIRVNLLDRGGGRRPDSLFQRFGVGTVSRVHAGTLRGQFYFSFC